MEIFRFSGDERERLAAFLISHKFGSIHQSWDWGEFQKTIPGREPFWVVGVRKGKDIVGCALVIKMAMPFGKHWLISPRGPVCDYEDQEVLEMLFEECERIGKEEGCVYVRYEFPIAAEDADLSSVFRRRKMRKAHAHHQPEDSLIIDISVDEEEILKQMKQKGRYNIKVAKKHEVKVKACGASDAAVADFYNLVKATTERNNFSGHNQRFYENMLKILGKGDGVKSPLAKLYVAEYDGEVIAGIIATFFGDEAIYYYGASGNEHRNVMAPFLLQWQAMLDAKELGCKSYDLFGIAPPNQPKHPWNKITQFKQRFGGVEVHYLPAREKVLRGFWYWVVRGAKWAKGRIS